MEWFHKEADHVKQEEEIKPTMFDGGPMFKDEEEFQKMKKSLAEDPYTPKGRWKEHGNIKDIFLISRKNQNDFNFLKIFQNNDI